MTIENKNKFFQERLTDLTTRTDQFEIETNQRINELERENNERLGEIEISLNNLIKRTDDLENEVKNLACKGKRIYYLIVFMCCFFVCFYIYCKVYYDI